jgi:autotransporter-associated beta strand protein
MFSGNTSRRHVLMAAVSSLVLATQASADTFYWASTTGVYAPNGYNTAALWSTTAASVTPATTVPGINDDVVFGWDGIGGNEAFDADFTANASAKSVTVKSFATVGDPRIGIGTGGAATLFLTVGGAGSTGINVEARPADTNPGLGTVYNNFRVRNLRLASDLNINVAGAATINTNLGGGRLQIFSNGYFLSDSAVRRVVTKTGTGTISIEGGLASLPTGIVGNDYVITDGWLRVANNNAIGATAASPGTITLQGTGRLHMASTLNGFTTVKIGDGTAGAIDGNIAVASAATARINGPIVNNGASVGKLVVNANNTTGTLELDGTGIHTYTGGTRVPRGTLRILNNDVLPDTGALDMFGTPTSAGSVDMNGFSDTVGALTGVGIIGIGRDAPSTLTVGGNNESGAFSGRLRNGNSDTVNAARPLSLTKIGTGTQILTAPTTDPITLGPLGPALYTYAGPTTINGGTLQVDGVVPNSSAFNANVGGTLSGTGTVTAIVLNGGKLAPGAGGAGKLNAASLSSSSTASVAAFELGGTVRGTDYDALDLTGSAALQGDINLAVINSYNPAYLASHQLIVASSVSGIFTTVSGLALSSNKYLAVTYTPTEVLVTATLPGDADVSGGVNFSDLLTLAANYNQAGKSWATGDFSGDGQVNFSDLLLLAQTYNSSVGSSFEQDWALAQSLVPEPTTFVGLAATTTLLLRRQRRTGVRH